jgi:hypothetical protein
MSSAAPGKAGVAPPRAAGSSVELVASALRRAVVKAESSLTIQEGLYEAYNRHVRCLADVGENLGELREAVDALRLALRDAFGFDAITGEKTRPSTLGDGDAATLLAHLRAASAAADKIAGGS